MRYSVAIVLLACGILTAAESAREFPLWDGSESIAAYAKRVNLPAAQSLNLGNGATMELVLAPAGKFVMGVSEVPAPVIPKIGWKVAAGICGVLGAVLAMSMLVRRWRRWRFPINALGLVLVIAAMVAGQQIFAIRNTWRGYESAKELFEKAPDYERLAHEVTLSAPFYMGKLEVTQAQFEAVMGRNPSKAKGAALPVSSVTWDEARAFCEKVSATSGKRVTLPTEAQWEFACRAGTTTVFHTGDALLTVKAKANVDDDVIKAAGSYPPNAFGLHDMHGNVWEWCSDFFADDYYSQSPARDPQGPAKSPYGNGRAMRGGSCRGDPDFYRSASRRWVSANDTDEDVGFRVVVPVDR